uniref:C2 domain-containing protein n=1 Tax=Hordeum vulgare subsp. vulgare TaxID=112509 RepID=A0A8I6XTT1_HORVV
MGNCCSDEIGTGRHSVGPASSSADAASAAADRFLRSRGAGASTQIESNPIVVVYSSNDGALEEIGRTEVIVNSSSPSWNAKIILQYQFEVLQPLVFHIYDIDPQFHDVSEKMLKLEEQQFLGEAICNLSDVVTKQNRLFTIKLGVSEQNLPNPSKFGELTVQAEESAGSKALMEMVFHCSDLEIKDLLSKSDPFLLISRMSENGTPVPICKTEVRKNDLNPKWKPVILNLQQVGSKESPLMIECFNFSSNGKHDLVGKIVKSVADLENLYHSGNGENFFVPASNAHDCHSMEVLKSQVYVEKYLENSRHTFIDYISAGCQLNLMVAIDYTASNGNPRLPDSLHYIDPSGRPNAYQRVILEIGDILQYYDPAKRIPSWGYGARPIDGPVSHCFNLNGSTYQPEVEGIQGIMSAYISALRNVSLAGPTLFGPLISTATAIASQSLTSNQQKYFILLIVTDGVVTDFQETIDAIIKASDFPMSIVVVGVGGADFKEMEFLDPNKGGRLESSTGRVASRDVIQFAPMKDVHGSRISIVQSLLAEIPGQFMTYMRTREIQAIS